MSLGSPVSDTANVGRDGIFVSYSHHDAAWVRQFKKVLKPLVRSKRLRLWDDTDIPVGDQWHPDIIRAIGQSSVALLLVSANFLDSDFIMEEELPTLIGQGVRLASVLVGDCLWKHVPELRRVQWLHDPGRDGALNLLTNWPGQLDRRLREICERLIAMTPDARKRRSLGDDPLPLPADSPLGYDPLPLPADSPLGYDPLPLPADSPLGYDPLPLPADSPLGYVRPLVAADSGHTEWTPKAAVQLGMLLAEHGDAVGAQTAYQQAINSGHTEWAPKAAVELRRLNQAT